MHRKFANTWVAISLISCLGACDGEEPGASVDLSNEISYTVVLSEVPANHETLIIDLDTRTMRAFGLDTPLSRRALQSHEFDELMAITTDEKLDAIFNDSFGEGASATNCPSQELETKAICDALGIAQISVRGAIHYPRDESRRHSVGLEYQLQEPTGLFIASAELIIFLEEMRLRVHEQAEAD